MLNDKMAPIVERALALGVAEVPTFLLRRSDGGTLYHTRDAATIAFREAAYTRWRWSTPWTAGRNSTSAGCSR